jgi:heptosyltransferase-3
MEQYGSILIINATRIGDTLVATPVIDLLHRQWPLARISVLGNPNRIEVLENLPGVARLGAITKKTAPFRGWLGPKRYDLALVYNYDESLVRYALRVARRVVAFRQKDEAINRRLYRCVDPEAYPTVHITEHFLRLPNALGLQGGKGRVLYRCRPEEAAAARERLASRGFADRRPLVGFQVASFPTKSYRDWPVENFLELSQRIVARWPQAGFLIYGGPEEKERTGWLKEQLGDRACLFAGQLSLRETAALMSLTDLYVGVDTGPTHLMSSFDIPIIGLYHPRHPARGLGPKDHPFNFSLDHPYENDLDGEPRPMSDITVDRVFAQVEKALAARGMA